MKKIVRLTESDLYRIIKESVKKLIKEQDYDPYSLDADEIYGDKAYREDAFNQKMQMFQDDWEMRNRRLRQKYPGKSEEWYEAMIDTFYENKRPKKAIKESHGEPESYYGIISSSILNDNEAEEMANEYNLSPDEAAMEWFKGVDAGFEEGNIPKWREFVCDIHELGAELYHDYGAGYYFLIKGQFNENTIKEATAGGGASGGLIGFSSNIGNGSGIAAGATNTQNTPQGNGDNTVFGVGLTDKKKKKSNTDIINHGRDIYNARGNGKSSDNENSDFFGDTIKRKNGKGGSISIPKHRV